MSKPPRDTAKRYWSKVLKRGPDQCWPWKASTTPQGYGQITCPHTFLGIDKPGWTMVTAHRMGWILTYGPIPEGLGVLHKCDNPPCNNPAHWFLGTQLDNIADMVKKGRHGHGTSGGPPKFSPDLIEAAIAEYALTNRPLDHVARDCGISESHLRRLVKARGIECRRRVHKLQPEQAQEIRDLYKTGQYTYFDLASKFGVTFANIGYIVRGKTFAG